MPKPKLVSKRQIPHVAPAPAAAEVAPGLSTFEVMESLFAKWVEWRSPGGPLADLPAGARELLFTILVEMAQSRARGYLLDQHGRRVAIGELHSLSDTLRVEEWGNEWAAWPEWVAQLQAAGFLAQTAEHIWYSPQMTRGEI